MKYITLIIGLLVVGCGDGVEVDPYGTETYDPHKERDDTTEKPVKELTLEQKVVGTYELKIDGNTKRIVILESGICEWYANGKKEREEAKWKIVNGEIHFTDEDGIIDVMRINPDDSLTFIAYIRDGKRTDEPKENQTTLKKIK